MQIKMLTYNFIPKKNCCVLCEEGSNCGLKIPTKKHFSKGGKFSHIKLPILEYEPIPEELYKYIFPPNFNEEYDYVPFHSVYSIKNVINKYITMYFNSFYLSPIVIVVIGLNPLCRFFL